MWQNADVISKSGVDPVKSVGPDINIFRDSEIPAQNSNVRFLDTLPFWSSMLRLSFTPTVLVAVYADIL